MRAFLRSLWAQLGALFLGFLVLVSGLVAATFLTLRSQSSDALVINLAGRQRMLIQQMTKDALGVEQSPAHIPALRESAEAFDATLLALTYGGAAPFLPDRAESIPPAQDSEILTRLRQVQQAWRVYREHLYVVMTSEPGSPEFAVALQAVQRLAPGLAQKADEVVTLFEAASMRKVTRLQRIQIVFVVGALALLAAGAEVTRRLIIGPLQRLAYAAERIGHGDLNTPVRLQGAREFLTVSRSLETMRAQLWVSQEALQAWAGELEVHVAQRTRELAALYDLSREISSRLDINHVLRSVTDKARELLAGDTAALCLLDETGQALHLQIVSGPWNAPDKTRLSAQDQPAALVLQSAAAVRCGSAECAVGCDVLPAACRKSHLAARLRVGDRVIGALCVGSAEAGCFAPEAGHFLIRLADSAAVALENARLYEQAERVAVLEERHRLAAEMHDGLAQVLVGLDFKVDRAASLLEAGQGAEAIAELKRIHDGLGEASRQARQTILSLQECPPTPQALQKRLSDTLADFAAAGGPTVELRDELPAPLFMPAGDVEQVLRLVREALLNAQRHSRAKRVVVRLGRRGAEAVVTVDDDGQGFDPKSPSADGHGHFGLSIMRARAARLGGQMVIRSAAGQGTHVSLAWPVHQTNDFRKSAATGG